MNADGSLIPLETINAVEIFTGHKLDDLLAKIRQETSTLVPDVSTVGGRKEIASLAYKVARSKTTIDDAGKSLVAGWKKQAAEVDASRKKARDYLDTLKDEIRAPLDAWEAEQARVEQEKRDAEERAKAEAEAAARAELERKEAELRAREEAIAAKERAEAERIAKEKAESERKVREELIRKEAEDRAKREAQEAIERAARETDEAKEAARVAAKKAEADRMAAIERAEREKQEAVRAAEERVRLENERKERERIAEDARIRAEEERRAADREHRLSINADAVSALIAEGIPQEIAEKTVNLIALGVIPNVEINY